MARTTGEGGRGRGGGGERRGRPEAGGGPLADDSECRGYPVKDDAAVSYTVVSQCNGQDDTIMYPKNTGDCGPLTLVCLDLNGAPLATSRRTLQQGRSLRRYSSQGGTYAIAFYCQHKAGTGKCKLEFDR
jgi:hypothetical protein